MTTDSEGLLRLLKTTRESETTLREKIQELRDQAFALRVEADQKDVLATYLEQQLKVAS